MARFKQISIVVVLVFVALAIANKPNQTSTLVQEVATLVGDVVGNIWTFLGTLFQAATKGA